ncbi:hypothetical protein OG604_50660 [Streptomyces sp. NBC_01231]|nr:hypothetical protein OG604_00205 [Streptomyces sp. NBC_01231]WSQ15284.1 hypothetical protein OG604_50660 [Streptomyces sp. NBC_01231]
MLRAGRGRRAGAAAPGPPGGAAAEGGRVLRLVLDDVLDVVVRAAADREKEAVGG